MIVVGKVKKGAYFDSVTLMQCGKKLAGLPGVVDAAVVMGTKSNLTILSSSGLQCEAFAIAGDTDLLITAKAETESVALAALAAADKGKEKACAYVRPETDGFKGAVNVIDIPSQNLILEFKDRGLSTVMIYSLH